MSAPPSPHIGQVAHSKGQTKRRDRPPALELSDPKAASDGDLRYERAGPVETRKQQPRVHISSVTQVLTPSDLDLPRPSSATSSLDPYYFGVHTPAGSPMPPFLPDLPDLPDVPLISRTPENKGHLDPVTPARNPASIDRRGLVGVGELATPRWLRNDREHVYDEGDSGEDRDVQYEDEGQPLVSEEPEHEDPDSPWTIEAIDGEQDEQAELDDLLPLARTVRTKRSVAEESGGEEILYPRNPQLTDTPKASTNKTSESVENDHDSEDPTDEFFAPAPPSSFVPGAHRAKKRSSDEFEMSQSGDLSKHTRSSLIGSTKDKGKEDKNSVRRHRSLGVGVPSTTSRDKVRERRRESVSVHLTGTPKATATGGSASKPGKHTRHTSASSSSSSHGESHHPRRVHTTDFSHLPPSPSSSSIQQFLKHSSSKELYSHSSPNIVQSLLRGTQEGWSGRDDEATAEALRKLDGLSGNRLRARSSVSVGRPNSFSRPGTPGKNGAQWEGVSGSESGGKGVKRSNSNVKDSVGSRERDKDRSSGFGFHKQSGLPELGGSDAVDAVESPGSQDEIQVVSPVPDKLSKRSSARSNLNFTPKRTSASSTNYTGTPTTSSRDSASLSAATSVTSVSAASSRHSATSKPRRNSAGSDVSSIHSGDAASVRDRAASLAVSGDVAEEEAVPPVPPLPKDLHNFKSPSHSSAGAVFPGTEDKFDDNKASPGAESTDGRAANLEVPQRTSAPLKPVVTRHDSLASNQGYTSSDSAQVAVPKTPSKKWSFSHALNIRLSGSPSSSTSANTPSAKASSFPVSPRSATFSQQLRKSSSRDKPLSPSSLSKGSGDDWSPIQPDAMASAASLASLSSVGSVLMPTSPSASIPPAFDSDRGLPSRSETPLSVSTNQAMSVPQQGPLSPTSSIRRGSASKRLTPSSIPFFRRSSSQSMQLPTTSVVSSSTSPIMFSEATSPRFSRKTSDSPTTDAMLTSTTPHKKSSMLSLGSLLKGSSSRRSLQDKSDAKSSKETSKAAEKERQKKEDKDRSESRISVLMGRKRGKTLSSTDPKKAKPVNMPPMQMSALPSSTAQRVANLKSGSSSSSGPGARASTLSSSRATSQTVSSMQKQSDASLRSTRNQLPTIAGSPSVGAPSSHTPKEAKDLPPSALMNSMSGLPKETPTKIPRIASRSSAAGSPSSKNTVANRRASLTVSNVGVSSADPSPIPDASMDEFGVMQNGENDGSKSMGPVNQRASVRGSPSTASRVPRQTFNSTSSTAGAASSRKVNRDSLSFSGLRKASNTSVASISSVAPSESHHRFSALSPSKGLKLLSPKMSLPSARSSNSSITQNIHQAMASPSSSRMSLSTPSPVPSSADDEELLGDEEMMNYIRRQQAKKLATGASQQELDELLRFPEPTRPTTPMSPSTLLKSSQAQWLSEYERKEVIEYPSVYYFGARSDKKPATPSNPTNNYGYDDERGDYLIINGDHLAYRYQVIDTLGKGSFGQVLHCRDHCTGESVAIKIIRNKKRFHHQALVEIKILDNLRKWDHEEKHHCIQMTEHFYFRNHLCIAMELLSINLYELIKANGFVGFTTALIRRFTSQMLLSLSLMRSHRIVHCDLKPENVLLKHPAKSAIKVIDFGSSCFEHEKIYTYIQSRFYRSPEVILGMNYHMAIDMWSLGCILAELYTGFPIFPGENEQEQLSCIMEVLGVPDKDFVNRSSRKKLFFDSTGAPRPVVNSKGRRRRPGTKTLAQVLRCDDELFVDFIAKCLVWDPERRMKPQAATRHPFITSGRRAKIAGPSPGTAKALLTSATSIRSKPTDTPKKSQISAPTPLTARMSRGATMAVPNTPSSSSSTHAAHGSSSRPSYRQSHSQTLSSYHSSRGSGLATTK